MDILDDMGVSKLLAKDFLKVNYSFNARSECGGDCRTFKTNYGV